MKNIKIFAFLLLSTLAISACKKDYTIGGSLFNAKVNMTTYDYLKTNHTFDTLVILIDKMQLKDDVNSSGTFFALTNYSIHNFIIAKQTQLQIQNTDENFKLKFEDLDFASLKDSLRAYMFKDQYTLSNLTSIGVYATALDGEKRLINLHPNTDYNNSVFTTTAQYIYLTKVIPLTPGGPVPVDIAGVGQVDPSQLLDTRCQTTGIITTTGILHVLNNDHVFTYFNDKNH